MLFRLRPETCPFGPCDQREIADFHAAQTGVIHQLQATVERQQLDAIGVGLDERAAEFRIVERLVALCGR